GGGCSGGARTPGPGWERGPTTPTGTREGKWDNSPVGSKSGEKIVEKRTGGRAAPNTVKFSVRTREYLTTAEIERLMSAARKSIQFRTFQTCARDLPGRRW